MEEPSTSPLPAAFLDFLKENGLDPSIYSATDSTPRYVRYFDAQLIRIGGLCSWLSILFNLFQWQG